MPNGDHIPEWAAIERNRERVERDERRLAEHAVRLGSVERSGERIEARLESFKDEILEAVEAVEARLNKRFDRQRAALILGLSLGLPLITALISALLAKGGP